MGKIFERWRWAFSRRGFKGKGGVGESVGWKLGKVNIELNREVGIW